ncbi:MAG: hypothetical protein RLZZ574_1169, partial [Cyanobacteriota bacterium]
MKINYLLTTKTLRFSLPRTKRDKRLCVFARTLIQTIQI